MYIQCVTVLKCVNDFIISLPSQYFFVLDLVDPFRVGGYVSVIIVSFRIDTKIIFDTSNLFNYIDRNGMRKACRTKLHYIKNTASFFTEYDTESKGSVGENRRERVCLAVNVFN